MENNNQYWFWFSFSYMGKNQGCCNVQATTPEEALQKTIDLGIHPAHDDIKCFPLEEPELEENKLYNPEELTKLGFERKKGKRGEV